MRFHDTSHLFQLRFNLDVLIMKTKQQIIQYITEKMVEMRPLNGSPKPDDLASIKHICDYASKMVARLGGGGDIVRKAQFVGGPDDCLAVLADCLAALQNCGDSAGPFTVEEVAERWGVSVRTVGDLIRNGQLGCFRPGNGRGVVRISTDHIAEYERGQAANRQASSGRHRYFS